MKWWVGLRLPTDYLTGRCFVCVLNVTPKKKGRLMAAEWPTHKVYENDVNSIKELLYTVLNNVNENHRDLQRRIADLEFQLERKANASMER
jgi:hypothetical protein